jgi:hypothetical protein
VYAEAYNRFVDEASMAAMAHSCAPSYTWPEANNCYANVYNRAFLVEEEIQDDAGVVKKRRTSRYNIAIGQWLPFDHNAELHPFGCLVYMYILKTLRVGELAPQKRKAVIACFMGQSDDQASWRCFILSERRVVAHPKKYCIFNEDAMPFRNPPQCWNAPYH